MNRRIAILLVVTAVLPIAGLVSAASPPPRKPIRPMTRCMDTDRVNEWYRIDARTLITRAGPHHFRIQTRSACPRLGLGSGLVFETKKGRGDVARRVCGDYGDAVYTRDGIPCPINSVTPISAKKFKALQDTHLHKMRRHRREPETRR